MNIENDIQVSVCVVTYNQENYIAECLESLVNQVTNFRYEIIVGEDCSTDGTRSIVQRYVEKYPDLIVPLFYKENIGPVENIKQVYKKAKGKYIAHMDGDDVALPNKLQKQYNILEYYTECNVCSHDAFRVNVNGESLKNNICYQTGRYTLMEFYKKFPFFTHSTKMFRNKYNLDFWDNLLISNTILDSDIHIENLIDGDLYHIGEKLGKYRVGSGITNRNHKYNNAFAEAQIRGYERGLKIFKDDKINEDLLRKYYALSMLSQAYNYAVFGSNIQMYKKYLKKSFEIKFIGIKQIVFIFGLLLPNLFFILLKIRNNYNNK